MNETSLDDLMLQAAYKNFFDMIENLEIQAKTDEKICEINNQMYLLFREILKEVLVQTEFQLNCYRCHEKLLKNDKITLENTLKSLKEETNLIKTSKNHQNIEIAMKIEEAHKEKAFLEEQCLNFESKVASLYLSSSSLIEFTKDLASQSKDRDQEIQKLLDLSDSVKDKSTNANNSSLKTDSEKAAPIKLNSPKNFLGSYFSGMFRKKESSVGEKS
jgi:hypothetical protein